MSKFLAIVIEVIFWIQIFLSPFLIFFIPAALLFLHSKDNFVLSVIIAIMGGITGVFVAERISRKYGCFAFMGKLLSLGSKEKRN